MRLSELGRGRGLRVLLTEGHWQVFGVRGLRVGCEGNWQDWKQGSWLQVRSAPNPLSLSPLQMPGTP